MQRFDYPAGKRFAFTIMDDTDVATVPKIAPIYDLFERLGMRVTKTVWPEASPEGAAELPDDERDLSELLTLAGEANRDFTIELQRRGFEIASHGATMASSRRDRTLAGFERFRELFGHYPRVHANHSWNRDNLYWGGARIDHWLLRTLYRRFDGRPAGHYQGHIEGSPYWWGDLCAQHIDYVRNLTFSEINLARVNPSMPYRDARRPLARWWFSATDAEDVDAFNELIRPEAQERLERDGGFCIVATHLGKNFTRDGQVHPRTRELLVQLARRAGWFPPVGELLDWLRDRREGDHLPTGEWRRMQWQWAIDLYRRRQEEKRRARRRQEEKRRARRPGG